MWRSARDDGKQRREREAKGFEVMGEGEGIRFRYWGSRSVRCLRGEWFGRRENGCGMKTRRNKFERRRREGFAAGR